MTGWEPIVVKPLIILRQIKTVETERDALLRPSEERHPSAWGDVEDFEGDWQIKQARGFRQFLLRGVKKVRAE